MWNVHQRVCMGGLVPLMMMGLLTVVDAQDVRRDAAQIARQLRQNGSAASAVRLLRQRDGAVPRSVRDEIADSLTAIAIAHGGVSDREIQIRSRAKYALLAAGRQTSQGNDGTSYDGSLDRLLRIALEGNDAGALAGLKYMNDQNAARTMMLSVATSTHWLARAAVSQLGREMGPEGLVLLRGAYIARQIVEENASAEVSGLASHHGWRR